MRVVVREEREHVDVHKQACVSVCIYIHSHFRIYGCNCTDVIAAICFVDVDSSLLVLNSTSATSTPSFSQQGLGLRWAGC